MMQNFNEKNEFKYGKFNYEKAHQIAQNCAKFKLDNNEEEMACGGERSCYD
ncbi:molybdopterin biosynthesis protein MoeB [Campylobacter concisus]|uniref:molybdopterin biosynthesis protein MoeB n=1 Tax=Campylobacter concisus TaxID=199 RepID=UPI0018845F30|nr:molybdopterin biosynthesis protein MoeB [Campylobacter concisus]